MNADYDDFAYELPTDYQTARQLADRLDRASIRAHPSLRGYAYLRPYVPHEFAPDDSGSGISLTGTPATAWTLVQIHPHTRQFRRTLVFARGPGSPADPSLPFRLEDATGYTWYTHDPDTWKAWCHAHADAHRSLRTPC